MIYIRRGKKLEVRSTKHEVRGTRYEVQFQLQFSYWCAKYRIFFSLDSWFLANASFSQEEEFTFAKKLFGEYYPNLPRIKIDKHQCNFLKSSLELTKIKMGEDRNGSSKLEKDKSTKKPCPLKNCQCILPITVMRSSILFTVRNGLNWQIRRCQLRIQIQRFIRQ